MKTFVMSDIQNLAFSAANNITVEGYTKESMNQAVRNAVTEACGGTWNYYNFMANRYKVFALMAEILPVAMNANLAGKFERFAQFKDTAIGDKPYFLVEDNTTYPVATVARGNGDIERNKIVDRNFTIATVDKAIKFYDEMANFMAGKMDMGRLTEKASGAMANYVGELISDTIYGSYAAIDTEFKATGAFDSATLNSIIENIKASNSSERVTIFGTTTGLSNVADGFGYSDGAKDRANSLGYYGDFRGSDLIALPQAYRASTQTLAVDTAHIIILPSDAPIVNVLFEGDTLVDMKEGNTRNDMQPEIFFSRRIGAAALTVPEGKFGMYKFI
jgi:hypothetical protein